MNGSDFIDLIFFAGLAVFLIVKLGRMLGNDSKDERPNQSRFGDMADSFSNDAKPSSKKPKPSNETEFGFTDIKKKRPSSYGNNDADDQHFDQKSSDDGQDFISQKIDILNNFKDNQRDTLDKMMAIDADFNPTEFLQNAAMAYEMIITAYAEENISALQGLISENIMQDFANAIKTRDDAGEDMDITIIGIQTPTLVDCQLDGTVATMIVDIKSRQTMVVYDQDRNIIEGDDHLVEDCVDQWHFRRDLSQDNPTWFVVAT